jgi:predicted ester cyclase
MTSNPESVLRTWFEEVWNQGREDTIDRLFAANGLAHGLGDEPLTGPVAFKPFYRSFRGAFPDIRVEIERTVVQGDLVAGCCLVTGTHTGDTMGKATGTPIKFSGMCMMRVEDGQIVEAWNSFDFLTLNRQLGLVPQPPA